MGTPIEEDSRFGEPWYINVTTWSMFKHLQKSLKSSETKFVPASEINFFGRPNSENTTLAAHIRSSPIS